MEEVNRVIEIDADDQREESFIIMRYKNDTNHPDGRSRPATVNLDKDGMRQDLNVILQSLGMLIINAEAKGYYKRGECMALTVEKLGEFYTNASVDCFETIDGKRI